MEYTMYMRKYNSDSRIQDIRQLVQQIKSLDFNRCELIVTFKELHSVPNDVPASKKIQEVSDLQQIIHLYDQMNIARLKNEFELCKSICLNLVNCLKVEIEKLNYNFVGLCLENKSVDQIKSVLDDESNPGFYNLNSWVEVIFNKNSEADINYLLRLLDSHRFVDFTNQQKQHITLSKLSRMFLFCMLQSTDDEEKILEILKRNINKDQMLYEKILLQVEILTRKGQHRRSIEVLTSIQEDKLDKRQKMKRNYLIGINYVTLKEYKSAFEIFKYLQSTIKQQKSKLKKLLIKYYYALCLEKGSKLEEAENILNELYYEASFYLEPDNIIYLEIAQLYAEVLFKLKKYLQSKNIYLVVVDLENNFNNIQQLAKGKTYNNLATVCTELNDYVGASAYYELALKIFKQQNCKPQYIQRVEKNLRYNIKKKQAKVKE